MPFNPPPVTVEERVDLRPSAGLCASCRFLQVVRSKRSRFVRCGLSADDPAFPRYPPLPRLQCSGYRADSTHSDDRST
ncbi:MAG: hypothetical protein AAGF23_15725 [Acidobacteriota bacterium]